MDQTRPVSDSVSLGQDVALRPDPPVALAPALVPELAVVQSRFRLTVPQDDAPVAWQTGLAGLLEWLGIDAELVPAAHHGPGRLASRLPRLRGWTAGPAAHGPVFAPWTGWAPSAFQHGGLAGLPQAQFVASYLLDHARSAGPGHSGIDCVLMSPHPATCIADEAGAVPTPRANVLKAMIRTARAEGRERLAIIVHARQRNTLAAMLMAAGKALMREGAAIDILTIEDALGPLTAARPPWDAIIAMPDLRGTVFTLLARASGVCGPWPLLWLTGGSESAGGPSVHLITSETAGEGMSRLALDAHALIHALALTLKAGGAVRAAWRLHENWARLRDSGVTTATRGFADAPYTTVTPDAEFLALLMRGAAVSKRPQSGWRALNYSDVAFSRTPNATLRVVS